MLALICKIFGLCILHVPTEGANLTCRRTSLKVNFIVNYFDAHFTSYRNKHTFPLNLLKGKILTSPWSYITSISYHMGNLPFCANFLTIYLDCLLWLSNMLSLAISRGTMALSRKLSLPTTSSTLTGSHNHFHWLDKSAAWSCKPIKNLVQIGGGSEGKFGLRLPENLTALFWLVQWVIVDCKQPIRFIVWLYNSKSAQG